MANPYPLLQVRFVLPILHSTAQKFFQRIWSYLLKKSLMENFIFCAMLFALTFG